MSAATATASTIGMQLDAALATLDGLSSPQLYAIIVLCTVLIATVLLGNAKPLDETALRNAAAAVAATSTKSNPAPTTNMSAASNGPEPRWYIFRLFNYGVLAAFLASVVIGFWYHLRQPVDQAQLLRILLVWCVCLIYFFGFFGVSIVHSEVGGAVESLDNVKSPVVVDKHNQHNKNNTKGASNGMSNAKDLGCGMSPADNVSKSKKSKSIAVSDNTNYDEWSDEQLAQLVLKKKWKDHELEKKLDAHRAVQVRRAVFVQTLQKQQNDKTSTDDFDWTQKLPAEPSLDYASVYGANCEIVIGYVPLPVGLVGPLVVNGESFHVPMATTEGCLVASTNRGAKAICAGGGATAIVTRDGITRAPCVRLPSALKAAQLKIWCETPENFAKLQEAFGSTTNYGKLTACQVTVAGRNAYVRLVCASGDAMGMNMVSKGSLAVIDCLRQYFDDLELVALSGNMCTDKKAAAINWLQGRGKSVVVEAVIPADVVRATLKTTVAAMVYTNLHKNLIGSAMAGALGGFNAHAANIVTAIFLATGQDPAQNVESSQCITLLEETPQGDLWMSCTMPSLEVGTVGGGTRLAAQAACLDLVGCRGGNAEEPGANARKLAMVVAAATLAGEMSLLAALAANTLVQAHMQHNRKK